MNLSVLIGEFLEYLECKQDASRLTSRNYNHYLKRFLKFSGDINPKNIDLDLIRGYKFYLSGWVDPQTKKCLKKVTQNFFLIALRSFLRYLGERGIQTLSAEDVELKRSEIRALEVPDDTEFKLLCEAPDTGKKDGLRDRAILETLFSTGLRVAELVSLNRDTIDLEQKEFEVIGKGGRKRRIFLSDGASLWLERYLAARNDTFSPLFIRFQGKIDLVNSGEAMRLTTRSIERIVEKYAKKIKLAVKTTPHTLRHLFATDLLTSGTATRSVKERLGSTSMSTLQMYAKYK